MWIRKAEYTYILLVLVFAEYNYISIYYYLIFSICIRFVTYIFFLNYIKYIIFDLNNIKIIIIDIYIYI